MSNPRDNSFSGKSSRYRQPLRERLKADQRPDDWLDDRISTPPIPGRRRQLRPRKSKVQVRNTNKQIASDIGHTSFRLTTTDKAKLRELAQHAYGGVTMSAALRMLIRDAWHQAREKEQGYKNRRFVHRPPKPKLEPEEE